MIWTCRCGYARNYAHRIACAMCGAAKPDPIPPPQPLDIAPKPEDVAVRCGSERRTAMFVRLAGRYVDPVYGIDRQQWALLLLRSRRSSK